MIKINAKEYVLDLKGQPLKNGQDSEEIVNFGLIISNSLLTPRDNNKTETLFDKAKIFSLSMKFYNEDEVEMDDADVEKLIKLLESDQNYSPLVIGQIQLKLKELLLKK